MQNDIPLTKDVVLIGGGHAHALMLRKWGMRPLPGMRLTVINPSATAPYTGMLPGHIAGHYTQDDLEIDLVKLARFAGARLIIGKATHVDPETRTVTVEGHGRVLYDLASLDVGITSDLPQIPGFSVHAIGAKPLDRYAARWHNFLKEAETTGKAGPVAVIGGGIAGVELALAMAHRLRHVTGQDKALPSVTILEAQDQLTGTTSSTRNRLKRALKDYGIRIQSGAQIAEITASGPRLQSGEILHAALTVGAAGATPHPWITQTALPLSDGFVRVTETLQVEGHPTLFAAGDCAHMIHSPRPKAGVFAVRAAPIVHANIEALLTGKALQPFRPQSQYLKLISLGDRNALAERGGYPISGRLLWRWKDWIDRKFMEQFQNLPAMQPPALPAVVADGVKDELASGKPLCAGCGSKVGPGTLSSVLSDLRQDAHPDVLQGAGDDAAILSVGGQSQLISTDHLRAFSHDPALMARISAVHALGDIWSMGARPQVALAQIILPRLSAPLQERTLAEIMQHAKDIFNTAGAEIVGGHTSIGSELTIGFTVTGKMAGKAPPISLAGAQPGDALLLTRPLGTGVLLAAEMQGIANGRHVAAMLNQMATPQSSASRLLSSAHAMTDVTGFGLAGHLREICNASGVGAELWLKALPLYAGAEALSEAGVTSSLYPANLAQTPVQNIQGARGMLLHDPQTAGGLLAAVAADQADSILLRMAEAKTPACQIGTIVPGYEISCR